MSNTRPTLQSAAWAMTGFLDAARDLLKNDRAAMHLRLYFYAVTSSGWDELAISAHDWQKARKGRGITAYVGTDHALTDPRALVSMRDAGVDVRLLRRYNGVYHPKVFWLVEEGAGHLLVGSNNLTLDGLKSNIEFATLTRIPRSDAALERWHTAVHDASDSLVADLLRGYSEEREAFGKARAKAKVAGTFTWSQRSSAGTPSIAPKPKSTPGQATPPIAATAASVPSAPTSLPSLGIPASGDLVVEIMPLETGTGGSQIQIPLKAARHFFGLGHSARAHVSVSLQNVATGYERDLTMTRFSNATARLAIRELDYRDRPCVVVFRPIGVRAFQFEIVRLSVDPDHYRYLLGRCKGPTREGSRRWIQIAPGGSV